MQGFLHWLRADSEAIKRDAQDTRDEVRVLTVHGSKGLEAPIVFLADATYQKTLQKERLLWREDGLPLWKVSEKDRDPHSQAVYEQEEKRQRAEHRRLLYVAMTRAEERLIVAGCQRSQKTNAEKNDGLKNWYDMIVAGMERLPGATRTSIALKNAGTGEGWRFGDAPSDEAAAGQTTLPFSQGVSTGAPMPDWLKDAARGEIRQDSLRPSSDPAKDDPPAASPLSDEDQRRFGRGLLIHRLLQILPDVDDTARAGVITRYLEKPGLRLDETAKAAITEQMLAILNHPDWSDFFGPCSRAEVPLVGNIGGQAINGQVDRLAVLPELVKVLDYKTNRPPPSHPDQVPSAYCRQMAIYRTLLREIFPGRPVQCALLWTEGPDLMILGDSQLDPVDPSRFKPT
jgi:ATP-dependent helicase/nuclease subunit A